MHALVFVCFMNHTCASFLTSSSSLPSDKDVPSSAMAEPDRSFPWAPVDLPELSLEPGPGDRSAIEQSGLASTTADQIEMEEETKLLLLGPQDEEKISSIFGCHSSNLVGLEVYEASLVGLPDHDTHKLEDKSNLVIEDNAMAAKQTHSDYEIKNYIVGPSLLDYLPMQAGGHGQRKCRRKRSTSWKEEISHLFGLFQPFACRGKFGIRKNNKHWVPLEVKKLVEGASEFGVGKWTEIKRVYFKRSFRKSTHLKDKWRDLLRACGIQVGSKQKVEARKATLRIVEGLKDKIINLHKKHAAHRKRASR